MSTSLLSAPLQVASDTVFVSAQSTPLDVATDISVIVIAGATLVVLLMVTAFLRQMKKVLDRIHDEIKPAAERTRVAAQNVEYISGKVREDMQRVHDVVDGVTDRLAAASDHMEDRLQEFNALMEVVQGEAERVFIDTASVVRGMQAGAAHVGRGGAPDPGAENYLDPEELDMLRDDPAPEELGAPGTEGTQATPEAEPEPR